MLHHRALLSTIHHPNLTLECPHGAQRQYQLVGGPAHIQSLLIFIIMTIIVTVFCLLAVATKLRLVETKCMFYLSVTVSLSAAAGTARAPPRVSPPRATAATRSPQPAWGCGWPGPGELSLVSRTQCSAVIGPQQPRGGRGHTARQRGGGGADLQGVPGANQGARWRIAFLICSKPA